MKRYFSILVALFIFAALFIQFSGKDVDNNHFVAEMPSEYLAFPLDEDILRQAGQGRRDGVEWYAEGRKKNVLFSSTIYDLYDQLVSLSQFQGQAVFLYFWASWCGPCINALPDLQNIKQGVANQPVVFLNLSLDRDEGSWRKAIVKHRIKGIHLRVGGWSSDVAKAYSVGRLPSYYLIDAQGLVVERLSGVRNTPKVVAKIAESVYPSGG